MYNKYGKTVPFLSFFPWAMVITSNHWLTWGENIQFSALTDDEGLGCNYTKIDKLPWAYSMESLAGYRVWRV